MTTDRDALLRTVIDIGVRVGLLVLLLAWCLEIVRPFIPLVVWGAVIAVALYPLFRRLRTMLGERNGLAATLLSLALVALLIVPTVMLSTSVGSGATSLVERLESGQVEIPAPPASVADWPLVGKRLHALWSDAATNLEGTLETIAPQLRAAGGWLLERAAGAGIAVLELTVSLVIAGLLLANAEGSRRGVTALLRRLAGARAESMLTLSVATVRSVAQGVLGIAVAQALLAGVGLLAAGVPGAGLWALLVLLVAVIQLPPILVLAPIIAYVFSVESTTVAVLFTIWCVVVSAADGVLKPLLLGRGVDVPMLVILLGAIGGMVANGIVGLFAGAVVLALGYELFRAWLVAEDEAAKAAGGAAAAAHDAKLPD